MSSPTISPQHGRPSQFNADIAKNGARVADGTLVWLEVSQRTYTVHNLGGLYGEA